MTKPKGPFTDVPTRGHAGKRVLGGMACPSADCDQTALITVARDGWLQGTCDRKRGCGRTIGAPSIIACRDLLDRMERARRYATIDSLDAARAALAAYEPSEDGKDTPLFAVTPEPVEKPEPVTELKPRPLQETDQNAPAIDPPPPDEASAEVRPDVTTVESDTVETDQDQTDEGHGITPDPTPEPDPKPKAKPRAKRKTTARKKTATTSKAKPRRTTKAKPKADAPDDDTPPTKSKAEADMERLAG